MFKFGKRVVATSMAVLMFMGAYVQAPEYTSYAKTRYEAMASDNNVNEYSYYITFLPNGATAGKMEKMNVKKDETVKLTKNAFTKEGYYFAGWNTKKDGTGDRYKNGQEVTNLAETGNTIIRLYAQWKAVKYHITYELNGGKNNTLNPDSYMVTSELITLKYPTRKGYSFAGWYEDEKFKKAVTAIEPGSMGDRTFYAKWKPVKYYVSFDGNNATSGQMARMRMTYGVGSQLVANLFTRKGYKFDSWNTRPDGTGNKYTNSQVVKNLNSVQGKTTVLYAQWKAVTYSISYELNGGVNSTANPEKYKITSKNIVFSAPTKKGYLFDGWYKDKNLTKAVTQIKSGSTGNKSFYAKWTPITYYVAFLPNGGEEGNIMKNKKYKYNTSYSLPLNTYKRDGYRFEGWNTKPDGSGKTYENAAKVRNLASKNDKVVKLYAQWKLTPYKITYHLYGGKNSINNIESYNKGEAFIFDKATKKGYKFGGWYKSASFKSRMKVINNKTTGNISLYAKWIPYKATFTFDGNGATSGQMGEFAVMPTGTTRKIIGEKNALKVIDVSSWQPNIDWNKAKKEVDGVILRCGFGQDFDFQDDYEFIKNAEACEKLGIPYGVYLYSYATNDKKAKSEAAHILRLLKGRTLTYPVYLDVEEPGTGYYAASACKIIGTIIQNNGYMFGVYSSTSWWNNYLPTVTEYTRWVAQYYTICQYEGSYDMWQYTSDGAVSGIVGRVDMNHMYTDFTQGYTTDFALPKNKFKRTGCTFLGWNTAPDGTGKHYDDMQSVKKSFNNGDTSITLYAQWKLTDYAVKYYLNGGKNNSANPASYNVDSGAIKLQNPTRTGYTFLGWYSDSEFTVSSNKIPADSMGKKVFYAKWSPNSYNIVYDGNGSTSGTMKNQKMTYDVSVKLLSNKFARTGYDFTGWNTAKSGTKKAYLPGQEVKNLTATSGGIVNLYAQWELHRYAIAYELYEGENSENNPSEYTILDELILEAPVREGYTFDGWYTDELCENPLVLESLMENPMDITLFAKWVETEESVEQ